MSKTIHSHSKKEARIELIKELEDLLEQSWEYTTGDNGSYDIENFGFEVRAWLIDQKVKLKGNKKD